MFDEPSKILKSTKGSLTETPLPLLIAALMRSRRTCGLELKRQGLEKLIIFEEGSPVACTSNLVWETLGKYLVEKKVLTEHQHLKLLGDSARSGQKLESLLVLRRLVDPVQLDRHVQANLARKILDCFRWTDARYRVVGDVDVPTSPKMNAAQLVFTGVANFYPYEPVKSALSADPSQRYTVVPSEAELLSELKLSDKDARLVEELRGRPALAELSLRTGLNDEEAARRLYALAVLGAVDRSENVPDAPPPVVVAPAPAAGATVFVPPRPTAVRSASLEDSDIERRALGRRGKRRTPWIWMGTAALVLGVGAFMLWARREPEVLVRAAARARTSRPPRVEEKRVLVAMAPGARAQPYRQNPREFSASGILFPLPELPADAKGSDALRDGVEQFEENEFSRAQATFQKLAGKYPSLAEAWYGVALAFYAQRQDEAARTAVGDALEANGDHAPSLLLAGLLDVQNAQVDSAKERLKRWLLHTTPQEANVAEVSELVAQLP